MEPRLKEVLEISRSAGWVLEPYAKELFQAHGLSTTRFFWAKNPDQAIQGARQVGYPLVAKVVSPDILHKSDAGGVAVGVKGDMELQEVFQRFALLKGFAGVLLDEMAEGAEVIVGSKEDPQFGTVVLVGIGGTSVEIYKDVAIRMAPLTRAEALGAINSLRGRKLLEGYRGRQAVDQESLASLIVRFSETAYAWRDEIESMDLNPVLCAGKKAVIADARILLKRA